MGTRADFYFGRGPTAEWLGSIAWDGYPSGVPEPVLTATSEQDFRARVETILASNESATRPSDGWPWPWVDSQTTDYAYAWDAVGDTDRGVWVAAFGYHWVQVIKGVLNDDELEPCNEDVEGMVKRCVFPDMRERQSVAAPGTTRSGVLVVSFRKSG